MTPEKQARPVIPLKSPCYHGQYGLASKGKGEPFKKFTFQGFPVAQIKNLLAM